MNFKAVPEQGKFSLFDSSFQECITSELLYDANDVIPQKDYDEIEKICNELECLCSDFDNIYYIPKQIDLLCSKFKKNFRFSIYCFSRSWISKNSFLYLIDLYSKQNLPEDIRWLLVRFFVEASFHNSEFSICFCKHSTAFHALLDSFADFSKNQSNFNHIFKLIYNLAYDGSTFFDVHYIVKLTVNAFDKKKTVSDKIKEKISFFIMNLFRSLTVKFSINISHPDNFKMITMLEKWFQIQHGNTFEHMLWAFYFWFRNTPDFMPVFYESYFFDIIMKQFDLYLPDDSNITSVHNETFTKIALSMTSLALFTDNTDYIQRIYNNLSIENIISLVFDINSVMSDETKLFSLFLCSNYAVRGGVFVQKLLDNELHLKIIYNFSAFSFPLKKESAYCIVNMILAGNQSQVRCFNEQSFVNTMNEFLSMQDDELILGTFRAFSMLIEINLEVINLIDQSVLEEVACDQPNEEVCFHIQKIMSIINNKNK